MLEVAPSLGGRVLLTRAFLVWNFRLPWLTPRLHWTGLDLFTPLLSLRDRLWVITLPIRRNAIINLFNHTLYDYTYDSIYDLSLIHI